MISYVHSSTVLVADQDRAIDFYTNLLGFEKREDNSFGEGQRWVTVAPPGQPSGLALLRPQDAGMEDRAPGGHTGISVISPDVRKSYEELSAKGVQFTSPPQQMPWGAWATWFTDPDDNRIFITEEQR